MVFDAVLFDLDGTLLYTLEDMCRSVNHVLKERGYPERTLAEVRSFVGNGSRKLVERSLPAGSDDADGTLQDYLRYYLQHAADHTEYYPGIRQMMQDLRRLGVKTGVVTNKPQVTAEAVLEKFFTGELDIVLGQREGVPVKPAPEGVWEAMEALGAAKERTLYVGDSPVDAQTAANAGLKCLLVSWGYADLPALRECGAVGIVSAPEEILAAVKG